MAKRILMVLTALAALTLSFSSCKKDNNGGGKTPATTIKMVIEPEELKLMVGKTSQLTVTISPADTKYTFKTANAGIATVSETGLVTAVAEGETVITVTAGDAEKTAKVKVVPASAISDSDYIGINVKPEVAKFIPPIYMPKAEMLKKENMDLYKEAMTSKGWEYEPYSDDPNGDVAFRFVTPKSNEDWRMWSFAYYHTSSDGSVFMLGEQGAYEVNPIVENPSEKQKKISDLLGTLAQVYGFTEKLGMYSLNKGGKCIVGFNLSVADRPLELMIYSEEKDYKGKPVYLVIFQIAFRGPKADDKSFDPQILRPTQELDVDYSMLLKRMK